MQKFIAPLYCIIMMKTKRIVLVSKKLPEFIPHKNI